MNEEECRHLWEGDEYGRECCALCGAVAERGRTPKLILVEHATEEPGAEP